LQSWAASPGQTALGG